MGLIDKIKDILHLKKKNKEGDAPLSPTEGSCTAATTTNTLLTLAFDSNKVMVIYALGGPGAGKGTQCARLVQDFEFVHLSVGDLLREEQNREGSQFSALIREHIRNGTLVPIEVPALLENAIRHHLSQPHSGSGWENGRDHAIRFDETVCMSTFALFFDTTEEIMLERLLKRGKTSGREDDNVESIKKRSCTFVETSMPVVDKYRAEGKLVTAGGLKNFAQDVVCKTGVTEVHTIVE
ncbi:P-loop containing nucleoside triphosphate hydrolase protein [Ceratobasidium sp. AG-I]|nr:P-loop containing nucleoside triphosphate hydrolase protein [Ceratobasidium sp. AG-I]